jgi:hypothetical protein
MLVRSVQKKNFLFKSLKFTSFNSSLESGNACAPYFAQGEFPGHYAFCVEAVDPYGNELAPCAYCVCHINENPVPPHPNPAPNGNGVVVVTQTVYAYPNGVFVPVVISQSSARMERKTSWWWNLGVWGLVGGMLMGL